MALNKALKTLLFIILIICLAEPVRAHEIETPVDVHIPIFLKALSFDRNLNKRVGDEIVMGIVFQAKFRKSLNAKNQVEKFLGQLKGNKIGDIPFRFIPVSLDDFESLKTILLKEKVTVLYITPLRAVNIQELVSICRSLHITSLTGVPEYCKEGVAVSVGSRGGSPVIIINKDAAEIEGADFSSQLLKLATIIHPDEENYK
jgi:hypothetical protein